MRDEGEVTGACALKLTRNPWMEGNMLDISTARRKVLGLTALVFAFLLIAVAFETGICQIMKVKKVEEKPAQASGEAEGLLQEGYGLLGAGDYERAYQCFLIASRLQPGNAGCYVGMGHVLKAQGKWDEAMAAYRKAIQLKPDIANAEYVRDLETKLASAQTQTQTPGYGAGAPTQQPVGASTSAGSGPQRRIALVIGNSNYKTNRLINPVNDATDMAKTLKQLGFEVDLLTDADQKKMDGAIRQFGDRLGAGGERRLKRNDNQSTEGNNTVALFFFAGHGVQVSGENYFIPIGANIEREEQVKYAAVPAGLVLDSMANSNSRVNIVLIDACRDNPFSRGWRSSENGLAAMQAARGMLIGYSTAPKMTASDGQGRNSPYTKNLLKYMVTPGMPLEAVFKNVRAEVDAETNGKQVPWESISIIGDFFFKR